MPSVQKPARAAKLGDHTCWASIHVYSYAEYVPRDYPRGRWRGDVTQRFYLVLRDALPWLNQASLRCIPLKYSGVLLLISVLFQIR